MATTRASSVATRTSMLLTPTAAATAFADHPSSPSTSVVSHVAIASSDSDSSVYSMASTFTEISTSPQLSVPIEGEGGREGRGRRCSARTASAPARLIGAIPLWTLDYRRPPSATDAVITAIKPADHPPVARQTRTFIFRIFRSTHIFTHSCTHLLPSFRSIDVPVHASSD